MQQSLPLAKSPSKPEDHYEASVVYMTRPLDRPEALPGQTYKIKWADAEHALYITINDVVSDGRRRPFEVFINSKNMEHYAWTVALTRMISAVFRRGGDVSFVVEELKAVFDPRGGQWMGGRYVPSLLAAIGEVIERHMVQIGFLRPGEALPERSGSRAYARRRDGWRCGGGNAGRDREHERLIRHGRGVVQRRAARWFDRTTRGCASLPQMHRTDADPHGRLRYLHDLRLLQMRVSA